MRCWRRLVQHWHLHWVLWIGINLGVFWGSYVNYKMNPRHFYLHRILGSGLCWSRGTASVLNINCSLLLLPVCRGLIRLVPLSFVSRTKTAHLVVTITVLVTSAIHSAAHLTNAYNFSLHYDHDHPDLNVATHEGQDPLEMVFTSVPGWTGLLMGLILLLVSASSSACVRRRHFNLFSYTHRLGFLFLLILIWHPSRGVLKEQSNLDSHNPGCNFSSSHSDSSSSRTCKSHPEFHSVKSQTWIWLIPPLVIYSVDSIIRAIRRHPQAKIITRNLQPGNIIHLDLLKPGMTCNIGQYVLLNCPKVSLLEWHPFTVSRCPSDKRQQLSIDIKVKGDWSCQLQRVLFGSSDVQLSVDGPFASPVEKLGQFPVCICIAGGIGITPYAAFFHHLVEQELVSPKCPRRIHLVWAVKFPQDFLWLAPTLCRLHDLFWINNKPDSIELNLHVTQISHDIHQILSEKHPLLASRIQTGRPNWKDSFWEWTHVYNSQQVGVFTCGPKSLNRQIRQHCGHANLQGANFVFVQETFS